MEIHVLIIDDEAEIADLAELYLKNENYIVHKGYCAQDALRILETTPIDLAVLDVMLPDMDGFQLCQKIREFYNFPIIMLTAKVEHADKITGLSMGADDYITKPFYPLELVARIKAQLRRFTRYNINQPANADILDIRGLSINRLTHECFFNEKPIILTPIEFSILWFLAQNQGKVVSSEQLFQEIWGEKYFTSSNNTITVHIRHLREKMIEASGINNFIKTVWGVGYKIEK